MATHVWIVLHAGDLTMLCSRALTLILLLASAIFYAIATVAETPASPPPPSTAPPSTAPASTRPSEVTIDNFTFNPRTLTVAPGTKVVWTNRDDIPHTVTSAIRPRAFASPAMDSDEKFSFVFTQPGTYRYFCSLHPHMTGEIVVK
jgi:plastocyanin